MGLKSERLRKLEAELKDLEQWQQLGLVPKKDLEKHSVEIQHIRDKIHEERERLQFLKENGETDEYVLPKRNTSRQAEPQTLPDIDIGIDHEEGFLEGETFEDVSDDSDASDEDASGLDESEEEDPFSDKNRWKRGILEDPDVDQW